MAKFKKKPIVIDAIQFTGINERLHKELNEFTGADLEIRNYNNLLCLVIPTLEGEHIASPNDWIIKGVAGECYPCKPDIFKATYDPVQEPSFTLPEALFSIPAKQFGNYRQFTDN